MKISFASFFLWCTLERILYLMWKCVCFMSFQCYKTTLNIYESICRYWDIVNINQNDPILKCLSTYRFIILVCLQPFDKCVRVCGSPSDQFEFISIFRITIRIMCSAHHHGQICRWNNSEIFLISEGILKQWKIY